MEIRLDKIGDERFRWQESLEIPASELAATEGILKRVDPVQCKGTIDDTPSGYVLAMEMAYRQYLACGRCLDEFEQDVETDLDLLIGVAADENPELEADREELNQDDLGVLILPTPVLDTAQLVVEQVQLGVPMKSLCRVDCAGLCPRCGANLNEGPCQCEAEVDPRWSALAGLAKKKPADG